MKRIPFRRTLLALAVLAALLALYLGYQRVSGRRAYEAWAAAARANGEKLTLKEVKDLSVIPEGFDVLSEGDLGVLLEPCGQLETSIPIHEVTAGGRSPAVWLADSCKDWGGNHTTWDAVRDYGLKHRPGLEPLLRRLDAGPFLVQPSYSGALELEINDVIQAVRHFEAQAYVALYEGSQEAARQWLLRCLRLERAISPLSTYIGQIGHLALGSISFKASWAVLEGAEWTDEELAEMDTAWEQATFVRPLLRGVEAERAWVLSHMPGGDQADDTEPFAFLARPGGGRYHSTPRGPVGHLFATGVKLCDSAGVAAWRAFLAYPDKLLYAQSMQDGVDSLRSILKDRNPAGVSPGSGWLPRSRWQAYQFVVTALALPNLSNTVAESALGETKRELVRAAIALKRFKLRHGAPPASLDELVPDLLEEVPWDWQAGKPLTYRLRADGSCLLYAWGDNALDDGGATAPGAWGTGPDLVWLPAAPPVEE